MCNFQSIPVKAILKQPAIIASHSHLFKVISEQNAVMVSHSQLLLFLAPTILPSSLQPYFTLTI